MGVQTPKVMSRFGDAPADQSLQRGSRWDHKAAGDTATQYSASESGSQFTMIDTTGGAGRTPQQAMLDERNRPLTDEELDKILPNSGYEVSRNLFSRFQSTFLSF
mmetsp:Transcript_33530/g.44195  ORF Transcript_33530/g.44195 Transcript_33530/m.44195 type:complete len:105 (-) Transcript_33530:3274-3588(-)